MINMPLDELKSFDPEDAANRIGKTILNVLRLWHKQALGDWVSAKFAGNRQEDDDYYFALKLISRALEVKTSAHNKSIEYLLGQAAINNTDAREYLENTWPLLRDRLE